jgi:hypothetical protein
VADAIATLRDQPAVASRLGEAGYARARTITWEGVVDRLLAAAAEGATAAR